MAEQLFQAGEAERRLGLELVEAGAETVLVVEADAAPLRRTLNGSRLGLKQRRLLGLQRLDGVFDGDLECLQPVLQIGHDRVEIIATDEVVGLSAGLRGVGEQLACDAEIRERGDLVAVRLKVGDDGVDPVLECLLNAARPKQVVVERALLAAEPGGRVGSVAAEDFGDAVLNRLGAIHAREAEIFELCRERGVIALEGREVFDDGLSDVALDRARPRRR